MAKFCPFCKEACADSCGLYDAKYQQCSVLTLAERTDLVFSVLDDLPGKVDDVARVIYEK